jgi:hypothetical protein
MRLTNVILALVIFYAMSVNFTHAAPIEGLALYITFDEGEGDLVSDLSGNNNNGTLMGEPKWVDGKEGLALQFSGEENKNYVEVPDHPSLNPQDEITCAAWIYSDDYKPTGGIISKYIGAGNQRSYDLHMHHDTALAINTACSSNGAYQIGTSTTVVNTDPDIVANGEWSHVAMTFKAGDFLRIYVNGKLSAETQAGATESLFDNNVPLLIGTDFQIGGAHNGQPREFTGIIDEVVIFNRALSEDEIKLVMAGMVMPVESFGKLTIVWGALKKL